MSILDLFKKQNNTILELVKTNTFLPSAGNTTLEFSGTDTKELFEQNLLTQPKKWHYRTNLVNYKLNNHGYRTYNFNEIDWAESVVIFGCSHVFGDGVDDADTLASQLNKIVGIPVINLGMGGTSMMYSLHNSIILRNGYPIPKGIVHLWTSPDRSTYYYKNNLHHGGPWNMTPNSYADKWTTDLVHGKCHAVLASMTSKLLWQDTKYYEASYWKDVAKLLKCDWIRKVDRARDLKHPGIQANYKLAVNIAKKLQL